MTFLQFVVTNWDTIHKIGVDCGAALGGIATVWTVIQHQQIKAVGK